MGELRRRMNSRYRGRPFNGGSSTTATKWRRIHKTNAGKSAVVLGAVVAGLGDPCKASAQTTDAWAGSSPLGGMASRGRGADWR